MTRSHMNTYILIPIVILSFFKSGCSSKVHPVEVLPKDLVVAFYNVENLFDTVDDPEKADEEFMPDSERAWTDERLNHKINQLSKVIEAMAFPDILGLAEVENQNVLELLVSSDLLKDQNYQIVHHESPDLRGIDVALLYRPGRLDLKSDESIHIHFPDDPKIDYTSRDIIYASFAIDGKILHTYTNHWPSKRDGPEVSGERRKYAALALKRHLQDLVTDGKKDYIAIIGDFNDEPSEASVRKHLGAEPYNRSIPVQATGLYNVFYDMMKSGEGSYNFRGKWNVLDHASLSGNFFDGESLEFVQSEIFKKEWMCYEDKKSGQLKPNRTYGGTWYFGGFSDHFPILIRLKWVGQN